METFDATWVSRYYRKGAEPPIVWSTTPATRITDLDVHGGEVFWPEVAILPDGTQVPRWRFYGALAYFSVLKLYRSRTPVLFYLSWEAPQIEFTMQDFHYRFSDGVLPAQPDLGLAEEEINLAYQYRL